MMKFADRITCWYNNFLYSSACSFKVLFFFHGSTLYFLASRSHVRIDHCTFRQQIVLRKRSGWTYWVKSAKITNEDLILSIRALSLMVNGRGMYFLFKFIFVIFFCYVHLAGYDFKMSRFLSCLQRKVSWFYVLQNLSYFQ